MGEVLLQAAVEATSDWFKALVICVAIIAIAAICYIVAFFVGAARRNLP